MNLNLEAKNKQEEIIKKYLEDNAGEMVADKINNGVKVVKDNKTLINKKTLSGFMQYACNEARKQAEKGSNCACVEDKVVYGWAMHYFEEDSIEGKLYNEDGTEYKKVINTPPKQYTASKPEKPKQPSLFDFLTPNNKIEENNDEIENTDNEEPDCDYEEDEESETQEKIVEEKTNKVSDYYAKYHEQEMSYPNVVVLIRVGDFYEAYNENAERIADILDLVITSKDVGLDSKIKLAGFPFHVKENYFKRINDKFNILVIENDEITFIDKTQNEIRTETSETQTFDKYTLKTIASLLDGKVIMK